MRREGDSLADNLVASLIDFGDLKGSIHDLSAVLGWFKSIEKNEYLRSPDFPATFAPELKIRLGRFLCEATAIPAFVDPECIAVAEHCFQERGYLSSLIYLCASLPEVYVVPDISSVLHVTGKLEKAAEQRIRSTATMVLSVLLKGGLLSKDGVGLVLTLRARLVHSVLRVLLLRGRPEEFRDLKSGVVPRIEQPGPPTSLYEVAYHNGWDLGESKIPCNQSELLYTLLTFGYVFLRSTRRMNLRLTAQQESAYLQTWNLVGYYMGVDAKSLPQTYLEAETMFGKIQTLAFSRDRASPAHQYLGEALLAPLERSLKHLGLKPIARLLTHYLTSTRTIQTLKLGGRLHALLYSAFPVFLRLLRLLDRVFRCFSSFSLAAVVYRYVSLSIIDDVLLGDGQPLALPSWQIEQAERLISDWKSQ